MSTDWTKKVWDKENTIEVFALRRPDGSVHYSAHGEVRVIDAEGMDFGWWKANHPNFTNTPPPRDWESNATVWDDHRSTWVLVRAGRRNGKPFAEVAG